MSIRKCEKCNAFMVPFVDFNTNREGYTCIKCRNKVVTHNHVTVTTYENDYENAILTRQESLYND